MNDKLTLNEDFDIPGADEAADMLGYDPDAEPTLEDQGWEYVASKDVYDEDGFRDSYMWYRKDGNNRFFFSSDVDCGDPEYFDWETEGDEAAQEWFDSYGEDEDDDPGFDEYDKVDEAVEDNLTAKAEIDTPRGTFYAYKGTWKDFENEDDRDDWGFWFDHYTDDNKHFKIMHNHIDNSAIAVLKEGLNESKRGFVEKYRGYSIHDAGDRYVITDEKGLNVGETRFGIPVCHGMIDDMIDGKEADRITEAKRTKFPRGFNLGSSNNQNVKVRNPYNYTIQELSINNKAKTFERGNFSMGRADIELKNRQEYEDIVDLLKDQGYTEVKSDYHSLRNKTRKGIREGLKESADDLEDKIKENIHDGYPYSRSESKCKYLSFGKLTNTKSFTEDDLENIAKKYSEGYRYALIHYLNKDNPNNYIVWMPSLNSAKKWWAFDTFSLKHNSKIIDLKTDSDITEDFWYEAKMHSLGYYDNSQIKYVFTDINDAIKKASRVGAKLHSFADYYENGERCQVVWVTEKDNKIYPTVAFVGDGKLIDNSPEFVKNVILKQPVDVEHSRNYFSRLEESNKIVKNNNEDKVDKQGSDNFKFIGNAKVVDISDLPRIGDSLNGGTVVSVTRKPNQEGYRIYEVGVAEDPDHEFVTSDDWGGLDGVNTSHWTFAVKPSLKEDTIKTKSGKWTNKGKEGTHGKFNTKKEADAQRKAMFAQGFTEDLDSESVVGKDYSEIKKKLYKNGYREDKENFFVEDGKAVYTWWKGKRDFINVFVEDGIIVQVSGKLNLKESLDDAENATKEDILEYAKLHGDRSAADLLLLGGYEFFDGTADEYDALLKELEGKADGEKVDESKDDYIRRYYVEFADENDDNRTHWTTVTAGSEAEARKIVANHGYKATRVSEMDSNDNPIDESFNNSSSSYYLTTVGDMIDGSVGNVDDEYIDKDLKFWRTVARTFNFVPGADNVAVLIADGEYDPEYYYPSWTNKPRAIAKKYPNAVFYDVPFFCVKEVKNGKMFLYFDSEESAKKYVDLIDSGIDLEDQDAYTEHADKHPLMRESLKEDLTPEDGEETFVASNIITAIEDEWKTISLYNNIITMLSNESDDKYKDIIPVIQDIVEEENVHVGQLQKALETISPDTAKIQSGEVEADGQLQKGEEEESGEPTVESLKESLDDDDIDTESERWEDIYEYGDDSDEYDDFELAGIYGGDLTYCPICGRRLEYDEDGDSFCPKCEKSAWELAQERRKLDKERKNESVEENPDDDIEGTEWYSTDIKEIPYGKNKKRIKNRKLVDIDKEPVRNPVNEGLEDSKENAALIRTALASGSLDRDAFIDYVLTNTPDEMLSGAVNFIGTSNFDTEDDLDFLGDGVDVTDSFANDLFIDEDTLEDGSVITLKDYSNGDTTALQNDSEPACDDCDDLPDGVDITLVDVDDDKPLEEEKPLQEMGPLAATLLTAVAPVVADKVMDKVLPENKEEENKVDDEVYGNSDDDDVDIKGI